MAIGNLKPQKVALVYTFCDEMRDWDKEYAHEWYSNCIDYDQVELPEMNYSQIYNLRGKDGHGGESTTHSEIKTWVTSLIGPR